MPELPSNVVKLADYRARLKQDSIIREMIDDAFEASLNLIALGLAILAFVVWVIL